MNTAVIDEEDASEPRSGVGVRDEGHEVHVRMLEPGKQIGGKYVVHGKLGQGGFAVVYDAEHIGLGRRVAIKVVHLDEETPLCMLERARREARISALVRHPNVLEVFDSGMLDDGSPYLVMERIHGETISARITRQGFTVPAVVEIGRQLLTALEVLAAHDIVHRDIKSDNVMLHNPGDGSVVVKLVDFGISKRSGLDVAPRLTTDGTLVGTPSYMSPEQLRGEALDVRTDIYSVGAVLYEALTGHVPHERTSLSELLLAALHDKVTPVRQERPSCPRELERIIMKALSKERATRYPDAPTMRRELESFAASCDLPRDSAAFRSVEPIEPRAQRRLSTGSYQRRVRSVLRQLERRVPRAKQLVEFTLVACVLLIGGAARIYPMTLPDKVATVAAVTEEPRAEPKVETPPPAPEDDERHLLKLERPLLDSAEASEEDGDVPTGDRDEESVAAAKRKVVRQERTARDGGNARVVVAGQSAPVFAMGVPEKQSSKILMSEALAAYALGRYTLTQQLYRRAAHVAPSEPAPFRGLGLVAARLGDYDEARFAFERYLALSPCAADAAAIRSRIDALPNAERPAKARNATMARAKR